MATPPAEPWKDYQPATRQDGPWTEYQSAPLPRPTQVAPAKPEKSGVIRRVVGDTAVDLGKGVVDLGEAAVGAADLVSGGHAGKALDAVGFDPDRAREAMGSLYSPERQQANQQV